MKKGILIFRLFNVTLVSVAVAVIFSIMGLLGMFNIGYLTLLIILEILFIKKYIFKKKIYNEKKTSK